VVDLQHGCLHDADTRELALESVVVDQPPGERTVESGMVRQANRSASCAARWNDAAVGPTTGFSVSSLAAASPGSPKQSITNASNSSACASRSRSRPTTDPRSTR
jgi:hypothetical protein